MFDIGFSELLLIGIAALVIFGPEDLPRVARTIGHLLGKFRRYVADVKSDISREMEAADLKNLVSDVQASALNLQASLNEQAQALHSEIQAGVSAIETEVATLEADAGLMQVPGPEVRPDSEQVFEPQHAGIGVKPEGEPPTQDAEANTSGEDQLDLFGAPVGSTNSSKE